MTDALFQDMVRTIYATFGRPAPGPEIRGVLYGQVRQIPDAVCAYATARICEQDKLPQNLGRELRNAWADWRAAHPTRTARAFCDACGDIGMRDAWTRDERGRWRHFGVPCPACGANLPDGRPPVSLAALERLGCRIMPVDYPGGPVTYDRDNGFGCLWPRHREAVSRPATEPEALPRGEPSAGPDRAREERPW